MAHNVHLLACLAAIDLHLGLARFYRIFGCYGRYVSILVTTFIKRVRWQSVVVLDEAEDQQNLLYPEVTASFIL